jgi:hypothetical protein
LASGFSSQLQHGFLLADVSVWVLGMVMVRLLRPSPPLDVSGSCF